MYTKQTSNLSQNEKNNIKKMYINTYKNIGKGSNNSINKFFKYYSGVVLNSNNNKHGGVFFWNNGRGGRKLGPMFSNNKNYSKAKLLPMFMKLLSSLKNHYYAELSGAPAHIAKKYMNPITNRNIIRAVIGNVKVNNNGSYERRIQNIGVHRKQLFGRPPQTRIMSRL
jgi:hypothetical protein